MDNLKEKLEAMTDKELLDVAAELIKNTHNSDSILRKLVVEQEYFILHLVVVNACLVQVLAKRMASYTPHLDASEKKEYFKI